MLKRHATAAGPATRDSTRDSMRGSLRPIHLKADGPAERSCMTCGKVFESEGWHNRLCRRCAKRSQPQTPHGARSASRAGRSGSS
jgi:hypothetical protein